MACLRGVGASPGIATGPAHLLARRVSVKTRGISPDDADAEVVRIDVALGVADQQIANAQGDLDGYAADETRDILEMHRLLLSSGELRAELQELIASRLVSAETAVRVAFERLAATFDDMSDPYFRERRSDLESVCDRVLRALLGLPEPRVDDGVPAGCIAVATDLSALCPFQLKRAGVAAVVTEGGGRTSHAALVARALNLPYVLGIEGVADMVQEGVPLLVDGTRGELIIRPDGATHLVYEARARRARTRAARLQALRNEPAVTRDGMRIHLAANVESPDEVRGALDGGAESIGLFRTELLYLERRELPSEEEQYQDAVSTLRALEGRPATFRTLDVAPDKLPGRLALPRAPNPALGLRSIRFSLRHRDLFRTQLRALYRAAAEGPMRIMFPLVSSLTEVREARALCADVRAGLAREGLAHDPAVKVGIMVETPSAAMTADHLARGCDFFSIGTNDLVQYAFAADRDNDDVGYLYRPLHPAILRMIKQVVEAGTAAGIPVGLCGDVASDPGLTWVLLGLGVRELSMDAQHIPMVKAVIRAIDLTDAETLAASALQLPSESEVEALVEETLAKRPVPDLSD